MAHKGASITHLAKTLWFERALLHNLLSDPQPWESLSRADRVSYLKIYTWYTENREADEDEDENDRSQISEVEEFDVDELVQNVRGLLTRNALSVKELAARLEIGCTILSDLIKYPEPWESLSEVLKSYYRSLNDWYEETKLTKKKRYVLKRINNSCSSNEESEKSVIKEEIQVILNPREVSDHVLALLDALNLTVKDLADRLEIWRTSLVRLLNSPQSWELLSDHKKKQYINLNAWFKENSKGVTFRKNFARPASGATGNKIVAKTATKTVKRLNGKIQFQIDKMKKSKR
jgi:predicted DNA-binding protein (UPF0251 family)